MTNILINLIIDMKICLAIAVGLGLLFGYLYTKLKAMQTHKPAINGLKKKIDTTRTNSSSLKIKKDENIAKIKEYNEKLNSDDTTIAKFKDEINKLEIAKLESQKQTTHIQNSYKKQTDILDNNTQEIKSLKKLLDLENITEIEDHKTALKMDLNSKIELYKQKSNSYEGLNNEAEELKKENFTLNTKELSLTATLDEKKSNLADTIKNITKLKSKLQTEYDQMVQSIQDNKNKIQNYKTELLQLKDRLF